MPPLKLAGGRPTFVLGLAGMNPGPADLLTALLKEVSRSFYLTLRVLPTAVRSPIGLAYLLARATDTIADTKIVSPAQRRTALLALGGRIAGQSRAPLNFGELARHQGLPSERRLLERVEEALGALGQFSSADRQLIREVLATIISGQELDLDRFAAADEHHIVALPTDAELDDYTWRVAGCVGGFWTKMCRAHLFPRVELDDRELLKQGVRFGQGLQLVNILRDLPGDLRQGRCYLPALELSQAGLAPADLLKPENEPRLRPIYNAWLARAEAHLAAGWEYTNALPFGQARVRLACAWPILIGMKTLARLRAGNVLDPHQRIKISHTEVRRVMVCSLICYACPPAWRRLFQPAVVPGGKV